MTAAKRPLTRRGARQRELILEQLRETTVQLDTLKGLYERRLALYQAARALDPPILMEQIAEAAGVTEVAITAALAKDRRRQAS